MLTVELDPPAAAALSALRERTGQSAQACVRAALVFWERELAQAVEL